METISYSSLKELKQRKERIREDLGRDTRSIAQLFNETFIPQKPDTRKEKIAMAVNIGYTTFDVVMLLSKLNSKYAIIAKSLELIKKYKNKK